MQMCKCGFEVACAQWPGVSRAKRQLQLQRLQQGQKRTQGDVLPRLQSINRHARQARSLTQRDLRKLCATTQHAKRRAQGLKIRQPAMG